MSILKMKRLRVVALADDRDMLLRSLMKIGCVEISTPALESTDPEWASLTVVDRGSSQELLTKLAEIDTAIGVIDRLSHVSKGLFPARRAVGVDNFFDDRLANSAYTTAHTVNGLIGKISALESELSRLASRKASLLPWSPTDIPLDTPSSKSFEVIFGVCPLSQSFDEITAAIGNVTDAFKLDLVHVDTLQQYIVLICHSDFYDAIRSELKPFSFAQIQFKEYSGTAKKCIEDIEERESAVAEEMASHKEEIVSFYGDLGTLETASDMLNAAVSREDSRQKLLTTKSAIIFSGWVPEQDSKKVEELLHSYGAAFDISDPSGDEEPPVSLYNNKLNYPFGMVTEMYSLPRYSSLDPNPLISFTFPLFFGLMYADLGYGIILCILSLLLLKKANLRRGTASHQLVVMMGYCGVATALWGTAFGGFFGDALGVFTESFLGRRIDFPALAFSTLDGDGPLTLLIMCLAIGVLHILYGMAIKAYMLIRDGRPWDALMDVGSWWLVFAGIAVAATGNGMWVALAGVAALILTQGRSKKGILSKFIGGIGSLYDITGYASDVLSYSRLMALGLATGVIASVFNLLGAMAGPIFFWVVFVIGHAFNMGINVIGTYVHDARLHYLEFFGKWYEDGGKPFLPLRIKTKYIDVVENNQEELRT